MPFDFFCHREMTVDQEAGCIGVIVVVNFISFLHTLIPKLPVVGEQSWVRSEWPCWVTKPERTCRLGFAFENIWYHKAHKEFACSVACQNILYKNANIFCAFCIIKIQDIKAHTEEIVNWYWIVSNIKWVKVILDHLHIRSSVVAPRALNSSIAFRARRLSSLDTAATVRLFWRLYLILDCFEIFSHLPLFWRQASPPGRKLVALDCWQWCCNHC